MEISEQSEEIHINFTLFTFHFSLLILQPIKIGCKIRPYTPKSNFTFAR